MIIENNSLELTNSKKLGPSHRQEQAHAWIPSDANSKRKARRRRDQAHKSSEVGNLEHSKATLTLTITSLGKTISAERFQQLKGLYSLS